MNGPPFRCVEAGRADRYRYAFIYQIFVFPQRIFR